ncbi:DUF421 domain-containing protein [Bradyrhizobium sp. CSA112]|uniref:DUF421 domain-containing protein n=1 Tax=Bradyrhizobium sp. CSA112 TaxID=2699170 RepID=UPI0023AF482D|nr:YetF domain-containing protein [Bradyrhizobium sp. CSA112]MDE5454096.1 DUF421 domain-containing protein [Bradyrhizobium sp. CSA112]
MDRIITVEWADLLVPTHSVLEMIVRGTVMYLALLLILRFVMKRQSSTVGLADILVIVLIADAAQNAFSHEYKSITEGVVLVLTIVFWDYLLNWLGYRFRPFERLLVPPPLPLVEHGRINRRNMRSAFITREELESELREQGVSDFAEVEKAFLESNGQVSVVKKDSGDETKGKRRKKPIA